MDSETALELHVNRARLERLQARTKFFYRIDDLGNAFSVGKIRDGMNVSLTARILTGFGDVANVEQTTRSPLGTQLFRFIPAIGIRVISPLFIGYSIIRKKHAKTRKQWVAQIAALEVPA